VQRDFTFVATSSDGVTSKPITVHVGFAEVEVDFAGSNNFHMSAAYEHYPPASPVAYPKTADNTVVIGQKVQARVVVDECFTLADCSWDSVPDGSIMPGVISGGTIIKNYVTNNNDFQINFELPHFTSLIESHRIF